MELKGKALYNLLRINWLEDPSIGVQPWQVEDYRVLSTADLFSKLEKLKIPLNEESFLLYVESSDSPEELVECLCLDDEDLEISDQSYLLLFELWRRLIPEKESLSIFCDELDRLIELYDKGSSQEDEQLQKALSDLEDVLDETVDAGASAPEAFENVTQHCAHDLEAFINDYISFQLESNNDVYASKLLDAFSEYMTEEVP